jgi:hypothetical protein
MRKLAAAIMLALACTGTHAQSGPIKTSTERNTDNSVSIFGENQSPVTYSVILNFTMLAG